MTDPSRKSLYFLKSLLIKVGKLLLERSENRTPQERKELQAKVRIMGKNRVITCVLLRTGSQQLKAPRWLLVEGRELWC